MNNSSSSSPESGSGAAQLSPVDAEHAAVVDGIAAALRGLGLAPGSACVLGDGLTSVDVGVLVGEPATQASGMSSSVGTE